MNKDNVKRLPDQVSLCSTRPAMTNTVGRSMVEMLGVLAIIGILSAGALAGYSKAMFQHRVNQTIDIFNNALQRVQELDLLNLGFDEIWGVDNILKYGILATCNATPDNRCQLPLGEFDIDLVALPSLHGCLELTFHDSKSCIAFGSVGWKDSVPIEWWIEGGSIQIGSTVIYDLSGEHDGPNEMTLQNLIMACQECDEAGECVYRFSIRQF